MKKNILSLLLPAVLLGSLATGALFKGQLLAVKHPALAKNKNEVKQQSLRATEKEGSAGDSHRMCCVNDDESSTLSGNSIYQLESDWKNQNGKTLNLSELRGKVQIVAMFYSHCTYACPLTINDMKTIESKLPRELNGKVGFVLVSIDPKRDTPAALKTLADQQQLDGNEWTLLTGTDDDIRALAAVLGVEYRKKSNGDFLHSSQIAVLDRNGEIVYRHIGLNQPTEDVVQAAEKCSKQD